MGVAGSAASAAPADVASKSVGGSPSTDTGGAADARAAAAAGRAAAARAADARAQTQESAASRLDDQRVSQLHGALVAERRRLQQPGKVSMEALASSLRDTETKLRKQYADKNIDFHVVVKDGKAMVKPIVG